MFFSIIAVITTLIAKLVLKFISISSNFYLQTDLYRIICNRIEYNNQVFFSREALS